MFFQAGRSLGFDLTSSLAAIDQWVGENDSDEDDNSDDEVTATAAARGGAAGSRAVAAGGSSSLKLQKRPNTAENQNKILSRENILSMVMDIL